jgi:hypothetical protein
MPIRELPGHPYHLLCSLSPSSTKHGKGFGLLSSWRWQFSFKGDQLMFVEQTIDYFLSIIGELIDWRLARDPFRHCEDFL